MRRLLVLALGLCLWPLSGQAAEPSVEELEFACIDEDQQKWLQAALLIRHESKGTWRALARERPRVLTLPALIHIRQGKLTEALADYDWATSVMPFDAAARTQVLVARQRLARQVVIADHGLSAYATQGFTLAGELTDVVGDGSDHYDLMAWQKDDCGFPSASGKAVVEVFREPPSGGSKKLGEIKGQGLAFEADTLLRQGPGHKPLIAVRSYTGGNCWGCLFVRAILLDDASVKELTLPAGSPGPISLLKDDFGTGEAVAYSTDLRWEFYGDLCHACSPSVVTIYRLQAEQFVEACSTFAKFYQDRIGDTADGTGASVDFQYRMGRVLSIVLNQAQAGELDTARATLHRFLDPIAAGNSSDAAWAKNTLADLGGRLDRLASQPPRACPVLGL